MNYYFGIFPFVITLAVGCSSSKKAMNTETPVRFLPALPSSQINIPIKVYMRPLLSVMDSTSTKEFTNEKWPAYTESSCDFRYKYRFIRSSFTFNCINNKVTIGFRGNYQIAGSKRICAFDKQVSPWVGGSCGFGNEPFRKIDLLIGSLLEFLPNHQLRTTTSLESSTAIDKCEVTVLQTDITSLIVDSIQASVDNYCQVFDRFVQVLNNNSLLQQFRNGGSRVMPVSRYGFLNLNPTQLRIGRFNSVNDTLLLSIGFTGTPTFSSDSLRLVTNAKIPPITNTQNNTGVSTYLDALYEYKFFNQLLNDSLRNKPFEVDGRTFVIKEITIGGENNGKLMIDVAFTGNRKGVLHLSGTPVLDTALQVIAMPDINFSIDTKDMLVNMAKSLFRKKIMKQLKNQTVFDIAALIQKNKLLIESRLNQPITTWMNTNGKLYELKVLGILAQKTHLQVQASIKADISLIGNPPASILKGF